MTDWLCSGSDVIAKAGAHVNSNLSGSSVVANWIIQSQGFIDAATRRTWFSSYSDLSSDILNTLKDAVSSHAAMKAIMYDTTGYLSREGDTLMNANDEIWREGVNILRDFKSNTLKTPE